MNFSLKPRFELSFLDLLFNLMLIFIIIAIIAVIHMNPPTKKSIAPKKAEFLIIVEWNEKSNNDIDVWLPSSEMEGAVYFKSKNMSPFYLDRDDTGRNIDTYTDNEGNSFTIDVNREVITARGWPKENEYYINLHFFGLRDKVISEDVTISIVQLNPYYIVFKDTVSMNREWQEKDVVAFTITDERIHNFYKNHGQFFAQMILGHCRHSM